MEDNCIVCGEIVPEGVMVCTNCEKRYSEFEDTSQILKADKGKPNLTLVPKEIIYAIEKVRSFGVKKYGSKDSWKKVEMERYHQALLRHTLAIWNDIYAKDKESGLLHLSHIATNVAFLLEMLKDKECEKNG